MASLIKPWVVRYVDANGKRCKSTDPGAKQVKERAAKWHGQGIPGLPPRKRIPLATSKPVAQRMLDDLVRKAERGIHGVPDPSAASAPLAPMLDEFRDMLGRKAGEQHVIEVVFNARRVLTAAGIATLSDFRKPGVSSRVETAVWNLTKGDEAVSPPTAAKAGKHARQFTRWLWRKKNALDFDPLAGVDLPSQDTQRPRRPLTTEELARLLEVVENAPGDYRGLLGPDRVLLYLTAVSTGLRAGELAILTPAHFDLNPDTPAVRLKATETKNGKPAEQPSPPAVATRLRTYLAGKPVAELVWPGTWSERSAIMFKLDLDRAGIAHTTDEGDALFHSLRHSFTTLLAAVAPVRVTQELSRHSTPVLTIGRYAHAGAGEKADAVGKMAIPGAEVSATLTRADLEGLVAVFAALAFALVAPPVAPALRSPGDGTGQMGTDGTRKPTGKGKKKTPGNPGV